MITSKALLKNSIPMVRIMSQSGPQNGEIKRRKQYKTMNASLVKIADDIKWRKAFWEPSLTQPSLLRVPLIITLFLLLWGFNVYILDKLKVPYHAVIKGSAPSTHILTLSSLLLLLYTIIMIFTSTILGVNIEFGIVIFYICISLLCILPINNIETIRSTFFRLIKVVFFPINNITFSEVLLADALTSISKIFKDISISILLLYCYFSNENIVDYHNVGIVAIALLSSLPYW